MKKMQKILAMIIYTIVTMSIANAATALSMQERFGYWWSAPVPGAMVPSAAIVGASAARVTDEIIASEPLPYFSEVDRPVLQAKLAQCAFVESIKKGPYISAPIAIVYYSQPKIKKALLQLGVPEQRAETIANKVYGIRKVKLRG